MSHKRRNGVFGNILGLVVVELVEIEGVVVEEEEKVVVAVVHCCRFVQNTCRGVKLREGSDGTGWVRGEKRKETETKDSRNHTAWFMLLLQWDHSQSSHKAM